MTPAKKILFLCPHPEDDAGYRYRISQFLPYLRQAGLECTVWPFSTSTLFRAMRSKGHWLTKVCETIKCSLRRFRQLLMINGYDVVLIHREVFPFFIPLLEKWVTSHHHRVLFSFDDAIHVGHHDPSALNHPLLYRFKYGSGINQVLRDCQCVIAGNRILAEHARRMNSNVVIVPTVVDCERFIYRPVRRTGQPLTIGWMGSRSTVSYLHDIEDALLRIAKEYRDRIQFRFYGYPEFNLNIENSVSLPFSLETEIDDLNSLDVGLMPLPDTAWTRGKCAFKAIQYMAVGLPTVASPVGMTTELIEDNVNGLLAETPQQWFLALQRLAEDAQLRERLSRAARKTIEERYSLQVWGPRFADFIRNEESQEPGIEMALSTGNKSVR